ncbi:MAG: TlyA family RNA methyltransferase [Christensenella sp.]|uniref:TlyA family RNA methyltransferase n=1 Tax=Christensenella sp. TaxID=1935934 RepID=UPI002B1F2C42|nr:TlyA family RNA methyltransferase [Christensenella sp.]MEA5002907.1 TlyA family RNA methyltransferase [Christensenella sp.]
MKKRIDVLLYEKGLAKSREKAKTLVIAGEITVGGNLVKSPSDTFEEDTPIVVGKDHCPYVSRGGLKLEKAMEEFCLDLQGKVCMDIGASTGGFTDCMLKKGASFVYAVDVGYGEFDWALRNDVRVKLMERTNARYLEAQEKPVDFVSIDVSFISLGLIFPAVLRVGAAALQVVALIKPQFEAGKEYVGKKGVVRDASVHENVICNVIKKAAQNGLMIRNLTYSPIKGPNGNIEYLALFDKQNEDGAISGEDVRRIVALSHDCL